MMAEAPTEERQAGYDPMYQWAARLFPVCRSITGPGFRETLAFFRSLAPELTVHSVPSGTTAFDWEIPDEWTIRDAFIADENGRRLVDFGQNNLHVVGYSTPVDDWLTREELDKHLHSLPDQPDAIPYITSYYARRWGFCLTQRQRDALGAGRYHVVIDSDLKPGQLNYGEIVLPGREKSEIFLSTYLCHPSLANNELSGPVVTTALARWLARLENRRHTYRIIFIPETIGSIVYLSRNLDHMKRVTKAGFVVTCVGDERAYSFLPSRKGNTLADRAADLAFRELKIDPVRYSFLDRGSDERQYCSPGADLPVCSIMRTKYGCYPEYHTSLDDLSLISQAGLEGAFDVLRRAIEILEANRTYRACQPCEPQLGKRGLYPTLSTRASHAQVRAMMNVLAYCDGQRDLMGIAETVSVDVLECARICAKLLDAGVIEVED